MSAFAREAAHVALEEVREIQYNLREAEEAQREVYTQREAVDAFNRTYTAAIEQVRNGHLYDIYTTFIQQPISYLSVYLHCMSHSFRCDRMMDVDTQVSHTSLSSVVLIR